MTDQELLELAAKAAGLNVKAQSVNADDLWIGFIVGEKHTREKKFWNPLTDDGDALRLAVLLCLDIFHTDHLVEVWHRDHKRWTIELNVRNGRDAATRRAIVSAAAKIGKSMEVVE
jgi:hypothetical protein